MSSGQQNKPASTKAKRSRSGCLNCRKSKIKCDESKPKCLNCQKSNKDCDYSIKLTWGGRPYKVPKAEKMNPVANLSRLQLSGNDQQLESSASNPALTKVSKKSKSTPIHFEESDISSNVIFFDNTPLKRKIESNSTTQPLSSFKKRKEIINHEQEIKVKLESSSSEEPEIKPSLNPSDNLNNLLRMTSKKTKISSLLPTMGKNIFENQPQNREQYHSLDQEHTSFKKETVLEDTLNEAYLPVSPKFSELFNNVSDNIPNLNEMLGTMLNEKLINMNPWSLLEEIENPFRTPNHDHETDSIIEERHVSYDKPSTLSSNHNNFDNLNELDEFAIDIHKIHNLIQTSEDNLYSIPMLNERSTSRRNKLVEYNDNKELEIIQNTPDSIASSISTVMEHIPRGLLPLPDMLLNVPYYYDSFLFYMNSTSSVLTPADSLLYTDNPFKIVLPKLAMTNDGLMSLIVAFGCAHKNSLLRTDASEIIDALLSRALSDLLLLLNNKDTCTSDLTLTIVLLFSSFLAFNYHSDKWKIHMKGAKQIFLLRGYSKPFDKLTSDSKEDESKISGEIKKSKLLYFLIRWFAYIDIFTNLSSPLQPTEEEIQKQLDNASGNNHDFASPLSDNLSYSSLSPASIFNALNSPTVSDEPKISTIDEESTTDDSQINYEIEDSEQAIMKSESHEDIDYMLGFKIKFLPIFSQLCKLIKHVNLIRRCNERLGLDTQYSALTPKIIENAIGIQSKFQRLKYTNFVHTNSTRAKSLNAVIASNHCFLLMGLIQLYRRVLLMPRNSKNIQEICFEMMSTVCKYMNTKEPNSLCVILPLFIAGCECENVIMRPVFIEKLSDFRDRGSVSAEIAIDIITKCWNSGNDWVDIMLRENTCAVFL